MLARLVRIAPVLFISFVFVQSLFFKFTNSPETQHIFGVLDRWAGGLGAPGLFAPTGPFSQYAVGSAELVASALLLASLAPRFRKLRGLGAILALAVISGAIFFHLFTPLGTSVPNADGTQDGGLLFAMACGVFACAAVVAYAERERLLGLLRRAPVRNQAAA